MGVSELLQKVFLPGKAAMINGVGSASDYVRKNPVTSGVAAAGGLAAGLTVVQIVKKRKATKKKSTRKKSTTKKTTKKKTTKKPTKRKSTKTKAMGGVYTAKNGTKYIRLANGKVRFISNKSASMRKKRKGGYR